MKNKQYTQNPYILFFPFLLIYVVYVLIVQKPVLWGDEIRHFDQAAEFAAGHFIKPGNPVEIRNGPGYPLWITLFMWLHIPMLILKLVNAVITYLSIVLLFKASRFYISFRLSLLIGVFWGCYFHNLDFMPYLYSENAAVFLSSLLLFFVVKSINTPVAAWKNKYVYFAGLTFTYLALTKVIFGYVIICLLGLNILLWFFNRSAASFKKAIAISLIAFLASIPYLTLTYSHTGKIFYWATSGGNNLYWMSTPYDNEYGNWYSATTFELDSTFQKADRGTNVDLTQRKIDNLPGMIDSLRAHHEAAYRDIYRFEGVERDEMFNKYFFENVKKNPKKFLLNCFSNAGRMLVNLPFSYSLQKPGNLVRIPLNAIIVIFSLLCLLPTMLNWKRIPYEARYFLFFSALYFGGSILGSAEIRMFSVIVPLLLFWIGIVLEKFVRIRLKEDEPFVK